jgi:hypothetical protein
MTKSDYIQLLAASLWRFPDTDGIDDVPSDWAADAWNMDAVRSQIVHEICRRVSKFGELGLNESQLSKIGDVLRTEQVIELYEALTSDSPHRELAFRDDFERIFARHSAHLPPPLTRDQIVKRLGLDEVTAAELLGDD